MNKLTFTIKPNDEVTLKQRLTDQSHSLIGRLGKLMYYWWGCRTVVVVMTDIMYRMENSIPEPYHYIIVMDKSGDRIMQEFPVECINKQYALRRDHKRYKLHNKTLIV